jgi:hypothetical protein
VVSVQQRLVDLGRGGDVQAVALATTDAAPGLQRIAL